MAGFFSSLVENELVEDWGKILDWLLDDDRFAKERGWEKGQVTRFTKRVKRLPGLQPKNYIYKPLKDIHFPQKGHCHVPTILMGTSDSEGRSIVRHIRNGIAHGRTRVLKEGGELYIEIEDFGKVGKDGAKSPTAYLYIPMSYLPEMYKIYAEIEKAWSKDRSKTQPKKGKRKMTA